MHRKHFLILGAVAATLTGCMDAEHKLGRGINNITEFARMGEIQRSVEQTTLMEGAAAGRTTGVIHGMNRTLARTAVGAFEILTFPLPSDPYITPEWSVHPDGYKPRFPSSPSMSSDIHLGFDRGDSIKFLPGSRFHVFD